MTADACLVFGGDGTILRALGRLLGSGVPTLGVNFGNVGFLASLPQEGWSDGLADDGRRPTTRSPSCSPSRPASASTRHAGRQRRGALARRAARRAPPRVRASRGTHVGTMRCDGMIIATPAGSTAYNLSCDGPLVVWDASVLVLNFVAPHSLGFRPLVLRPDHEITVQQRVGLRRGRGRPGRRMSSARWAATTSCTSAPRRSRARLMVREGVLLLPQRRGEALRRLYGPRMLAELAIDDLVLIARARLQFAPGLNVITGETGAGKSLLAQAVGLLMGQKGTRRAGARRARRAPSCRRSSRSGDESLAVARELPAGGRSRAFINGLVSSAAAVEEALRDRVAFYGQLEHARLLHLDRQLDLLDAAAADDMAPLAAAYELAYQQARELERQLNEREQRERDRDRELDLLRFQVDEIERPRVQPGRRRAAGAERERLRHAEKLLERVGSAATAAGRRDGGERAGRPARRPPPAGRGGRPGRRRWPRSPSVWTRSPPRPRTSRWRCTPTSRSSTPTPLTATRWSCVTTSCRR